MSEHPLSLTQIELDAIGETIAHNLTTRVPFAEPHMYVTEEPFDPFVAHPAFGYSYDWHSAVNSSWAACALDTLSPDAAVNAMEIVRTNITADHAATELQHLKDNPRYERPYGWAWLVALHAAAPGDVKEALEPLAGHLLRAAADFLNALIHPIRHGVHSNTAFAMVLWADAVRAADANDELAGPRKDLQAAIRDRARDWFSFDHDYPTAWDRSGHDFLSPALTEAELLAAILNPADFAAWWHRFVPTLAPDSPLVAAVDTHGSSDAQQVHYHGLNLSRAGQLARIGQVLDRAGDPVPWMEDRAAELFAASADQISGGVYASTHWLPAFALRAVLSA